MAKDRGNTSHSTDAFNAGRELTKRKNVVENAINDATGNIAQPATKFPAVGNSAGKKKNKQFLKDKRKLDSMSRADIEKIRAKLIADREAKKNKKPVPLL